MVLDRGTLAKIDRRVFAELEHASGSQMAKVPVSDAVWSTWKRYCEAMSLSMGEGIAGLITHELGTLVNAEVRDALTEEAAHRVAERSAQLDARERDLDDRHERLGKKEAHLVAWQRRLQEQRASAPQQRTVPKIGRNEQCPCGSGFKYKLCHGIRSRRTPSES